MDLLNLTAHRHEALWTSLQSNAQKQQIGITALSKLRLLQNIMHHETAGGQTDGLV